MAYQFIQENVLKRCGRLFKTGQVVNLGIGVPTFIPAYIPNDVQVVLQSENGFLGMGAAPEVPDPDLQTAGGRPSSIVTGGCFFDSSTSFSMIRGGHVDAAVLGFFEVDQDANIANFKIPGKRTPGMGGAMDLVVGAKTVYVAGSHLEERSGTPKIRRKCTLPLTGVGVVKHAITDAAFFTFKDGKVILEEVFAPYTLDWVKENTEAEFEISPQFKVVTL